MTPRDRAEAHPDEPGRDESEVGHKRPHTPEEITAKLRQVGALVGRGMLVIEAIRAVGISDSTYYRWRAERRARREQGGPDPDQAQRLRRLEVENTRLRRAVADLVIERQALKEAVSGDV